MSHIRIPPAVNEEIRMIVNIPEAHLKYDDRGKIIHMITPDEFVVLFDLPECKQWTVNSKQVEVLTNAG